MIPFTESLRYEFTDVTAADTVIDAGCFEGQWSSLMHARYGCRVIAFEPVPDFFHRCLVSFQDNPKIQLHKAALGDDRETFARIGVKGGMSGFFRPEAARQEPTVVTTLRMVLKEYQLSEVAVLKLNVEAAEFQILEHALDNGYIGAFRHVQAQPHDVIPDAEARWAKIVARMEATHELVWAEPWVWFGWRRRT